MSAGLEPGPSQPHIELLGRKVFDLVAAHVMEWGGSNKPRVEAVMALGYAFGGLIEQHSDEDCQLFTDMLLTSAKFWSDLLKESRARRGG